MQPIRIIIAAISAAVLTIAFCVDCRAERIPDAPASGSETAGISSSRLGEFIVRKGAQLMEGEAPYRFLSFNIPELVMREEPYWGFNHRFEQSDALRSIRAFGGRATRCYVMSVSGPNHPGPRHIRRLRTYDEDVFRSMDYVLAECHRTGVRLIVPMLDNWTWWGGIREFSALRGKGVEQFYTDAEIKADYRHLVEFVLTRVNSVTGVRYCDDPAILGWETGNELRDAPVQWTLEMAEFMKSLDPNHLVIDGNDHTIHPEVLESPFIDVVVKHYYRGTESTNGLVDYEKRLRADVAKIDGRKPLLIGEFGFVATEELLRLADAIIELEGVVGGLVWSLRQHDHFGGFRWHIEGTSGFAAYHWPGFPDGDPYDERPFLRQYHAAAMRIQDRQVEPPDPPDRPTMLPVETVYDIRWQGSVGATGYDVQRSTDSRAWSTIATDVIDSVNTPSKVVARRGQQVEMWGVDRQDGVRQHVFMQDLGAEVGRTYWYRVRAKNATGASDWSDSEKVRVTKQSGFENVQFTEPPFSGSYEAECLGDLNSILLLLEPTETADPFQIFVSADAKSYVTVTPEFVPARDEKPAALLIRELPPGLRHLRIAGPRDARLIRMQFGFGDYRVWFPR